MSSAKFRPSSIPESIEAFADKQVPTSEELECQRRGYKLSRITLGKGAYAKVKLATATPMKLEKDRYLKEELRKQGDSKVFIIICKKLSKERNSRLPINQQQIKIISFSLLFRIPAASGCF